MTKIVNCKACGQQIANSAKTCPHCGAKNKKPVGCLVIVGLLLIFVFIGIPNGEDTPIPTETPISNNTPATTPASKPASEDDKATFGEKNALRSANHYLQTMPFSYSGLVKQLEYEGYTTDEATYGADNCGANWNDQALRSAKHYLDTTAFSYAGLVHQLEYEGYTNEEAIYGVDRCGADWNEQAAKSAKHYLDSMPFSRNSLIKQLEYEGFTHEQAIYGVEQNGY